LGAFGELFARWFLSDRGVDILATNLRVGAGEIDLVIRDGNELAVVEVRTLAGSSYPLDAIDDLKRKQVRSLAGRVGIRRCDGFGVGVFDHHAIAHWDPDSF
jgi:putative endonuclease